MHFAIAGYQIFINIYNSCINYSRPTISLLYSPNPVPMRSLLFTITIITGFCLAFAIPIQSAAQELYEFHYSTETYFETGDQKLTVSVFKPILKDSNDRTGAVLLFSGGGWRWGEPEWTYPAARFFAERGVTAIPVQSRLSGDEITPIEAFSDVCRSFRWVRKNAKMLGIDPDKVAGYGESAGGQLLASTVTVGCPSDDSFDTRAEPDAVLLWSPAVDLAGSRGFENLLQGRGTAEDYSPFQHLKAGTPPTNIVHGDSDTSTPLSASEKYCERMVDLGDTCELNVYENLGHMLTRNLEIQAGLGAFDPDPEAVADALTRYLDFLAQIGF